MNKFSVEKHGYPATKSETATNPQNWQTAKPARTVPVGIVYLGIMCLAVLIGGGYVGAYYLFDKSHDAPSVVQAHAVPIISTNTPEPTATQKPSRTPYPTLSHTAQVEQVQNDNEIVYVDRFVTVEVTRVIERVITWTPQPATPTLTATKDLAPEYAALALSAAKRGNMLRWAGAILVIITFAFIGAVLIVAGVQAVLPEPINVEETADEIRERVQVNDIRRDERIIMYYKAGWPISKIQEKLFGYTGGADFYTVQNVIDRYNEQMQPTHPTEEGFITGNT